MLNSATGATCDPFEVAGAPVEDRVVVGQADQDRPAVERPPQGLRPWSRRRPRSPRPRSGRAAGWTAGPWRRPASWGSTGASPSITSACPSWNFDSRAIRIAARTASWASSSDSRGCGGRRRRRRPSACSSAWLPARALPVPFWRNSFLPEPATSARPRVLTVPTRRCGQVHQHDVVQQLLVHLAAEVGRVDRFLAHLFAGDVVYGDAEHDVDIPDGPPKASRVQDGGSTRVDLASRLDVPRPVNARL